VYNVTLPSGQVTDLGAMSKPSHQGSESWAYWGVAEFFDGAVHLVCVKNSTTITRTRVPDGATTTLASFSNLSDMASFTVSLSRNRWYFHHESSSQFGGSSETLGYADAVFSYTLPPAKPLRLGTGALTAGGFQLTVDGPSGAGCQVLVATNLATNWSVLTNLTLGPVPSPIVDPNAAGARQRFYRATSP
jgi:hypothetical protein